MNYLTYRVPLVYLFDILTRICPLLEVQPRLRPNQLGLRLSDRRQLSLRNGMRIGPQLQVIRFQWMSIAFGKRPRYLPCVSVASSQDTLGRTARIGSMSEP